MLFILRATFARKLFVTVVALAVTVAAYYVHQRIGNRYEAETLLLVGQGLKERTSTDSARQGDAVGRLNSLARIVETDDLIRKTADVIGFRRLFPDPATEPLRPMLALRQAVSARVDGKSDLIRITFRHRDPEVAAAFVNELSNQLIAREADLFNRSNADDFFRQQMRRLEDEVQTASSALLNFSKENTIYSVEAQRDLLLKRANELASQLAATRGAIADRNGQKQSLTDQLFKLRPVVQSHTVSTIVTNLGAAGPDSLPRRPRGEESNNEPPPLLLVKVYQDSMAALVKVNTELVGAANLEQRLGTELEEVNTELTALAAKEAEYDRLKRTLARAQVAVENYGRRMLEEQINDNIAKNRQLSSLRVAQIGEPPELPLFPRLNQLMVLALGSGLMLGTLLAGLLELLKLSRLERREAERDTTSGTIGEAIPDSPVPVRIHSIGEGERRRRLIERGQSA